MANWYVVQDGKRLGPHSDSELRSMAAAGKIRPHDGVLKEGMAQPVEAARVKGLFPPHAGEPARQADNAAERPTSLSTPPDTSRIGRFKAAAESVSRAAAIQKLQLHDLPQADFAIGNRAYELGLGGAAVTVLFEKVRELEAEIEAKRQPAVIPPHETLGDRAKRLAAEAKKRVDAELLLKQRKQVLVEAGRVIREDVNAQGRGQLGGEIEAAQKIADRLTALEAEDQQMGVKSSSTRRLTIAAAVIGLLVVTGWLAKDAFSTSPEEQHQANLTRIETESRARQEIIENENKEQARQAEEERKRQEAELQERQAKLEAERLEKRQAAEAERQRRALAEEKERLDQERRAAEEEAQRQARQRAKELKDAEEAESKRRLAEEEHRKALEARLETAKSLFSKVKLDPAGAVELSASLKKRKAEVSLKATGLEELRQLINDENWLGLVNHLLNSEHVELPENWAIESAWQRLRDHQFYLLLETAQELPIDDQDVMLMRIMLPFAEDYDEYLRVDDPRIASIETDWERHPDGAGYLIRWRPADGPSVIAVAEHERIDWGIRGIQADLENRLKAIRQKVKLGEIDADAAKEQIRKSVADAQANIKAAALKL